MNFKKWMSAVTLCVFSLSFGAAPALADDTDTAIVGEQETTPNLEAVAQAMAAATQQLNNTQDIDSNSNTSSKDDTVQTLSIDYVTLASPAQIIDGVTYLPLRATLEAMNDQALSVEWKADAQQKLKLYNDSVAYEVYLTADDSALQVAQGGASYALKNFNGTVYVAQSFFRAIIPNDDVNISGGDILVLSAKGDNDVWVNLWGNMNAYQVNNTNNGGNIDINYPDVDTNTNNNSNNNTNNNFDSSADEIINGISDAKAKSIVATAIQYLGVPYVWGGTSPSGFDCSGLVQYVYAQNGISLPRTTYDQITAVQQISIVALQPGDLVFWGGSSPYHVGIYIGDGQYIHAPAPGQSVCIQSYSAYAFDTAARVIG